MLKPKSNALIVTLTIMLTGLSITALSQSPEAARSQQDFEKYIITETNTEQKLRQENTGSGSSTNINCGTNLLDSSQQLTCPNNPGGTPTPGTTFIPVVTQRVVTEQKSGGGIYSVNAPCNADEVVTGGGWDVSAFGFPLVIKEFAVNNAWHIETLFLASSTQGPMTVYAECLKIVPAQ